jgi:dienelactone hydrolase
MKRQLLITVATAVGAMVSLPSLSAAQAPPMGGGYADVVSIPVNDPSVPAIAGALLKPTGSGPFPAVVYMSGCGGLGGPVEPPQERVVINDLNSKGFAVLVVDPYTVRGEKDGVCAKLDEKSFVPLATRGGNDTLAAVKLLKSMPDIDADHIFLHGYSWGAISSLFAVDSANPANRDTKIAGLIAYYPYCYEKVDPTVPTLVMIGEKDDWTPAALCQLQLKDKKNVDLIVYPGLTHAFTMPFSQPADYLGHHFVYDEKATKDAADHADAFLAAHSK